MKSIRILLLPLVAVSCVAIAQDEDTNRVEMLGHAFHFMARSCATSNDFRGFENQFLSRIGNELTGSQLGKAVTFKSNGEDSIDVAQSQSNNACYETVKILKGYKVVAQYLENMGKGNVTMEEAQNDLELSEKLSKIMEKAQLR